MPHPQAHPHGAILRLLPHPHTNNTTDYTRRPIRSTCSALRQAWKLDDTNKAERLVRNLARRLEPEASGVAASILEGLDEMLTVNRLDLPASTNSHRL
jgi:putative transposase